MGFIYGFLAGIFLGSVIISSLVLRTQQRIAIEHGYAKRVMVDSITGDTEFRWNNEQTERKVE